MAKRAQPSTQLSIRPSYIIGPYKYGIFSIPEINLINLGIYLGIYTLCLPLLYRLQKLLKLPKYVLTILFVVYVFSLFYVFGVVTIGYIIFSNVKNVGTTLIKYEKAHHSQYPSTHST